MIEIIAAFARWSQLTANLILFGSCVFLAIIWQQRSILETPWMMRLEKIFPWLAGIIVAGLIGILATTTSDATGDVTNAWNPAVWMEVVQQTQIGHIWSARMLFAVLMFYAVVKMQSSSRTRGHYALWAVLAALPLIAGTLMSHSSADEMSFTAIAPYAIHILLAGIWFGALPAFLLILLHLRKEMGFTATQTAVGYLKKFSALALPVMLLLMITGVIVTDRLVDEKYYALVASAYGWLLNFKLTILAIILVIAYQARNRWLPLLERSENEHSRDSTVHLTQWVRIEFVLALLLLLFATVLANTLPAKHAMVENWPYPFRFSIDATWDQPDVQDKVWSGIVLFVIALGTIWLGIRLHWSRVVKILVPGVLGISSMALALPPLAVEAFPETYKKPTVPIDAISIVAGAHLYAENCVNCHGPQGKGTKPVADPDLRDPTDLLTQEHTAKYTVGNVFHQLSSGIPGTEMPGYADKLSEEERWDLINFLHAMSRGFDARLLGSMIVPETPAIASPVFNYTASDGSSGNLKDFRLQKNVLMVLFAWPQAKDRFFQLAASYDRIRDLNTEILAVPIHPLTDAQLQQITEIAPFPIVTEGWQEIKDTYWWYRRVRVVPDLSGKGMFPQHMEFVTDRFGYLRARWVAQFEGFGWQNVGALTLQLTQLNQEGEIMPPPGEHAH
ncbi:putative copper resistance protein D [Nitrosomonas oligotropha]|uniref:Putative copper resistance protein D n=2 Tax=Nitrosomonas TaxID=914 RepID=A0A2T5I2V2_9PROT|nr:CopD family protein [Nitrosomonas oligotropha]PTQ78165.1 putative copper resistance protein D [Nitrosomonas oligotropha]